MGKSFAALINTRLETGAESQLDLSRFNGFPSTRKPLKWFLPSSSGFTGLKPGASESAFRKALAFVLVLLVFSLRAASFAAETEDGEYEGVAEEYIKGYLAAHPLEGTALGLHEYDGKITDYSRLALDAELSRL